MKIYNTTNVFQRQRFTINGGITSKNIPTGDVGRASVKNRGIVSLETVETTRLTTMTQATLARFEDFSPKEIQQAASDAPIFSNLTPGDAQSLISEDGYYGVAKTSKRIADFVLAGSGDDLDRLQQGRQGVLQGMEAAEKAWGGKLPDISYATIEQAIKSIDDRISQLGGSIVSVLT